MHIWCALHGGEIKMDKFSLMASNFFPRKEYFIPEKNQACPGCGLSLAVRQIYKTIESLIVNGTYDMSGALTSGTLEVTVLKIPKDGGEIVICLDNEAGGSLKESLGKSNISDASSKGFNYLASASPSYPFDLHEKVKKGLETDGNAYIHILTPCPHGWQFDPEYTVKVGYWAVESRAFPLYEVVSGAYEITVDVPKPRSVADYLKAQKRFEALSENELKDAQTQVDDEYKKLAGLVT